MNWKDLLTIRAVSLCGNQLFSSPYFRPLIGNYPPIDNCKNISKVLLREDNSVYERGARLKIYLQLGLTNKLRLNGYFLDDEAAKVIGLNLRYIMNIISINLCKHLL